jgi:hypothetical protein
MTPCHDAKDRELGRSACTHAHLFHPGISLGKSTYMLSEADGAFAFIDKHGQAARVTR